VRRVAFKLCCKCRTQLQFGEQRCCARVLKSDEYLVSEHDCLVFENDYKEHEFWAFKPHPDALSPAVVDRLFRAKAIERLREFRENQNKTLKELHGKELEDRTYENDVVYKNKLAEEIQAVFWEAVDKRRKIKFFFEGRTNEEVTTEAKKRRKLLKERIETLEKEYLARFNKEARALGQEKCFESLSAAKEWAADSKCLGSLVQKCEEELTALEKERRKNLRGHKDIRKRY